MSRLSVPPSSVKCLSIILQQIHFIRFIINFFFQSILNSLGIPFLSYFPYYQLLLSGPYNKHYDCQDDHKSDTTIWSVTLELLMTLLEVSSTRTCDVNSRGVTYTYRL